MPETTSQPNEQGEPVTSATSPPSEPASTPAEEYRYQSGPLAGLTASEAAARFDALQAQHEQTINAVNQYVQTQQQAASVTPASAPPDSDLWITDPGLAQSKFQQSLMEQLQAQMNQAAQPLIASNAGLAKNASRTNPEYADVWSKYGKEIEAMASRLPPQNLIDPNIWNEMANMVRGKHIDEIATEKAKALIANMPHTEDGRSVGQSPLAQPVNDAVRRIREHPYGKTKFAHLSDAKLIEQAAKMGNTIAEYADMIEGSQVVFHPNQPNEMSSNLVREIDPNTLAARTAGSV